MEQITNKVLPKDLAHMMKRTLYIKFFTLIILNNLFWLLISSFKTEEIASSAHLYPENFITLVIKTTLMVDAKTNTSFALLNNNNKKVLSKNVKFIEQLKNTEHEMEESFRYLVAVPQEDYLTVINSKDRQFNLIPLSSLKYLSKDLSQEHNYEINF